VQKSSTWHSGGERHRFAHLDGVASTLTSSYRSSYANTAEFVGPADTGLCRPRFYTRRECARLMGFPETQVFGNGNSSNRAYKQLGNAVCPPLIQAIAHNLLRSLGFVPSDVVGSTDGATSGSSGSAASESIGSIAHVDSCADAPAPGESHQEPLPGGEYSYVAGGQPPLRDQLAALPLEQLSERLQVLGESVREPDSSEFVRGFKAARRTELLDALCAAYGARVVHQPRVVVDDVGIPLPDDVVATLLEAVRMMCWKENVRPGVDASGYVILKRPTGSPGSWHPQDPRTVRRRVWDLSESLLRNVSQKASDFHFTAIAVSRNFRGSPHIDKNDISVQYALSLGEFDERGGKLCVEESPLQVRAFNTRGRIVCFDGRFPHWVSGYDGERYSVIFYRSAGVEDPRVRAVHEV